MVQQFADRAKMTTPTTGTGTITLGSAVTGFQTFAAAGITTGSTVRYVIEDLPNWEIGLGTYTASGTTLSRGPLESNNAGAAISLSGSAIVYVTAAAADINLGSPPPVGVNVAAAGYFTTLFGYASLTVGTPIAAGATATLNSAAAQYRLISYQTASSTRWQMGVSNTAESGANVGSDFSISAFSDAGAYLYAPISIVRSTGAVTFGGSSTAAAGAFETAIVVPAMVIDLNTGSLFSKTIAAATTFTIANTPPSGVAASFLLQLTNGGAFTTTWWSGIKWPGGTPPTLSTSGVDVLGFYTANAGTTWYGFLMGKGMA